MAANRNIVSERELLTISRHEKEMEESFKDIISDILVLAGDNDLNHMLIDHTGQEIVRVEKKGDGAYLVSESELQNKADRYYFKETMALEPGHVFISAFDLNIEHGEIEKPLKPMIRFGIPVADHEGTKQGMLILNYLGETTCSGALQMSPQPLQAGPYC